MYQFCSEVKKFLGGLEQVSDQIHSPKNSFTDISLVFSTILLLRSIIQHVNSMYNTSLLKEISVGATFKQISKWHFKNPNALLLNKTILITMNAGDHSKAKKEANKLNKIGTYHECKCK